MESIRHRSGSMEKSMTTDETNIKNRLELLHLSSYLNYVFEVCRAMGYSRDTFYRAKKAHEEGVLEGLREKSCYKECWSHKSADHILSALRIFWDLCFPFDINSVRNLRSSSIKVIVNFFIFYPPQKI